MSALTSLSSPKRSSLHVEQFCPLPQGLFCFGRTFPCCGPCNRFRPDRCHRHGHVHWRTVAERPSRGRCLLWHPLRSGTARRGALDAAATADSTPRHRPGGAPRTSLPTGWQHRASAAVRGLPLSECLRACNGQTAFAAAGLSLDPWRRAGHRNGCGLRPLGDGGGEQHCRGDDQLSPGRARLAGRARITRRKLQAFSRTSATPATTD